MSTKMLFLCSCGASFEIENSEEMIEHLNQNTAHVVTEGYVHVTVVANSSGSSGSFGS